MCEYRDNKSSLSLAIGTFLVGSLTAMPAVNAGQNPFDSKLLERGYMVAEQQGDVKKKEGTCGEGKCGGKTDTEAVCGIYQIGSSHKDDTKVKDGKCGGHKAVEALCGSAR